MWPLSVVDAFRLRYFGVKFVSNATYARVALMADKVKNVFISHVHEDDEGLAKLKELLAKSDFYIRDASITSEKPNEASSEDYIKQEILAPGIQWASTLIVYITPDTADSEWVNWEIEYAQKMGKRIVGVWAHGANESNLPTALDAYADSVVGWNSEQIIEAITGKTTEWKTSDGSPRAPRPIARYSCR
jgi:hypothetical protein